jgi:hypothetical protein
MTVEGPKSWIIGVKSDHDAPARWHQYGIAHGAGKALAVDLDDLEFVTVQVHRMRHAGLVDEDQLDPLAIRDRQGEVDPDCETAGAAC